MDDGMLEELVRVVRQARRPMTIGDIAVEWGVSRPTAAKYVDIAEAGGRIESYWFATARQVRISGRRKR